MMGPAHVLQLLQGRLDHPVRSRIMTRSNRYIHSRAARLNVERLETRDCPACVVYQTGGVVHVVGDESANTIDITEFGTSPPTTPGGLTITADGVSRSYPVGSVRRIGVQ